MPLITIIESNYYGIWSQCENGKWFLLSSNDDELFVGFLQPTNGQIDTFRNKVMGK